MAKHLLAARTESLKTDGVGMPLLQMNESAILGTKLSVQVARCVSWRIARCYDPDALFKVRSQSL